MASGEAVLERMLRDCECVTVAILTQELRFVGLNSIQLVLDYARDKDNLQLIYSVSYTDEGGNLVLSHKTGQELEELRKVYKEVGASLFGIRRASSEDGRSVTQKCWRHELELVERELQSSLEKETIYIPSYIALQTPNIRTRKYERVKQGDSALCAPVPKPVIITAPRTASSPIRQVHEATKDAGASASQSRTTNSKETHKATRNNTGLKQRSIFGSFTKEGKPKAAAAVTDESDAPMKDTVASSEASDLLDEASTPKRDTKRKLHPSVDSSLSHDDPHPAKRDKVVDDHKTAEDSADAHGESSLFDCDEPLDAMELDAPSCNDGPVTYVEKVTKDIKYVESGYYVAEETNEYEQVTAPSKPQSVAPLKQDPQQPNLRSPDRILLKAPQRNMRQLTVTSFWRK